MAQLARLARRVYRSDAFAFRIVAAAPEFASLHLTLLLHPYEHWLPAFRACRSFRLCCLRLAGFKPFNRHIFCETARLPETFKLTLNLRLQQSVFSEA